MAKAGQSDETSIRGWLHEPYFQSPPPKSTGRELFGRANLQQRLNNLGQGCSNQHAVASLTSFSAAVVAQDLEQLMQRDQIRPLELIVAGGGRHNPVLMDQLQRRCRGIQLSSSQEIGLPVEAREALVFALLAWWHQRKHQSFPCFHWKTNLLAAAQLDAAAAPLQLIHQHWIVAPPSSHD
jgi:anhydro-N-acetylmuramic acid kinase